MENGKTAEEVTQAQINKWKEQWSKVYKIKSKDGKICYCKKPDLKVSSLSGRFIESDTVKGIDIMLEYCWLGGDEAYRKDDEYKLFLVGELGRLFKKKEGTCEEV